MQLKFDARTVAPQEAFEPLPTGWYTAMIIETGDKDTNSGTGKMLEVKMEVIGGDWNKRKIFDRLNLVNPNPMAVDIAYRTLSAICHATGVIEMEDTQQLHGKPILVKVKLRAARTVTQPDGSQKLYDANNEVDGYKVIDPSAPPVLGPPKSSVGGGIPGVGGGAPPAWAGAPPVQQQTPANWANQQQAPAANPQFQQPAPAPAFQQQPAPQQWQQPAAAAAPAWAQPPAQQPAAAPVYPQPAPAAPQGQPAAQPWAQPAAQPPAQAPTAAPVTQGQPQGNVPPWQQPGQPGAAPAGTPPWQQPGAPA